MNIGAILTAIVAVIIGILSSAVGIYRGKANKLKAKNAALENTVHQAEIRQEATENYIANDKKIIEKNESVKQEIKEVKHEIPLDEDIAVVAGDFYRQLLNDRNARKKPD